MARTEKQKEQNRQAKKRYYRRSREKQLAYNRKYRAEHKEQIAKWHRVWWANWYALNKESRKAYGQRYREEHSLEIKTKAKDWRCKLKLEVLTHYGGGKCRCVKCGESRMACLSLDHIQGGGTERRRRGEKSGVVLYIELRKLGFPKGTFQTLCMNCQWVKRIENNELPFQSKAKKL